MKCVLCNGAMSLVDLDDNLKGLRCLECEGTWIKANAYWKWLKSHEGRLPEKPESETADLPVEDSVNMKICPDCGHFLTKRKVGHGISFHIDRCQCCGGIWLDRNEWEVLKSRNLHDEIHFMFSQEWQEDIRAEERRKNYDNEIEKLIGKEDFAKVSEFKKYISSHIAKNIILAYLQNN